MKSIVAFFEKNVNKKELIWSIAIVGFFAIFIILHSIGQKIEKDNIYHRAVYLNAVITGKKDCFSHSNCITYTYTFKGKVHKDQITTVSFRNCKEISLTKGSELSIIIDSLNPENNIIDPKYGCK